MKKGLFCSLVIGLLGTFVQPAPAPAADQSVLKMTLSANESYLKRFRKEREALAQATDAESVKKREALDKKIKNLEIDNERLTKNLVVKPSAAPAQPGPAAPAPAVLPKAEQPAAKSPVPAAVPKPPMAAPAPGGSAVGEWEKMSRDEKESYVRSLVDALKREGRTVERHPLFYTALMDYVFVSDAALAAKPLKEAIVATIQKNEAMFSKKS